MSVSIQELRRTLNHIEECDELLKLEWLKDKSVSSGAREAVNCSLLQRRANLIDKLRSCGVEVEV